MKLKLIIACVLLHMKIFSIVSWSGTYVIPHSYGPSCNGQEYVEVGFFTNFETNNSTFQIQRSTDPNFSGVVTGTTGFNGNFNGCGTCSGTQYSILDYGPFLPGQVWYYRVKATSNFGQDSYKTLGSYTVTIPTIINWISQVASSVTTGSSPNTESSYIWHHDTRDMQGVTISLMPTEISKIYLEQNNHKINFSVQPSTPFINLEVSINNGGYINLYNGSGNTSQIWQNASSYFTNQGNYNLKVNFTAPNGTIYAREYDVYVVSKSDALFIDNYCNTMRVWKSSSTLGVKPLVLSEGFDAYNTKSEQYYRKAGNDLINCLLNKGFDIYIVNYNLNAQSIKNNGAIFQSAIRHVSSINSNKQVIAAGMSMGGIINRYACAKAENDGVPLPIEKFLTLDAPHQGAVISKDLQDWRKSITSGDIFAEHASNNEAAFELLNYNAYDPSGTTHTNFYSYLNSLNGDGYPHLVQKIGVSFSTQMANPNSGKWLYVQVTGIPGNNNQDFYLSNEELVPGSFLPSVNIDPSPVSNSSYWALINTLRPISNPMATIIQYTDPTFIPHNSSLDIVNGVSKFDVALKPSFTGFHDVIPADLIEPIVNALINENLYLQNKIVSVNTNYIARNKIEAGSNVTNTIQAGNFIISSGTDITMTAGNTIILSPGFITNSGSNFVAKIDIVHCDGIQSEQYRMLEEVNLYESNRTLKNDESKIEISLENEYDKFKNIDNENDYIRLYPNPNSGLFTIKSNNIELENSILKIYDVTGKILIEQPIKSQIQMIDVSFLDAGLYNYQIISNKSLIKSDRLIIIN